MMQTVNEGRLCFMDEKSTDFNYSYSATQQEEIRNIRKKYAPATKEEDKMEQLRRLDESVTKGAGTISLIMGILSCLVLGIGMCCTMVWAGNLFILGIIIGIAGIAGVIATYPLYMHMVKKKREKLAPEIMRITDELLK